MADARRFPIAAVAAAMVALALASPAGAQPSQGTGAGSQDSQPPQQPSPPTFGTAVTVVGTTPLPGVDLPLEKVPAPVQTATDRDIERTGATDLSDVLNQRFTSVHVNEIQGNPFQVDLNYRGYTASPLLGTPQGLSVYMDGVRLNQPFGDVVSWDLVPRVAISSITMMPGSNPLFGLNTLGGALAIQTKDGRSHPGTSVVATYGSHMRRAVEFEHGMSRSNGVNWYLAGNLFAEDGWRASSPSDVGQLFGKLGWHGTKSDVDVTSAYADNSLTGNGLQDQQLLDRDYASVYTLPDTTDNRSIFVNVAGRHRYRDTLTFSGNAYYRHLRSNTLNGDVNEDSLDQDVYQPNAAEQAALAAAGYTGFPTSGESAANTPFPFWRCVANVLLQDEPAETCNGLINRTASRQHHAGLSGQFTRLTGFAGGVSQFTAGAAYDYSATDFLQSTELGYLNLDRSVTGTGAFADGITGGTVDGEPFDTRVDLNGHVHTFSLYATDTVTIRNRWHVTLSGRYNQTNLRNRDAVTPAGGEGSLDGDHTFRRFNPAAGVTISLPHRINAYGGYSEGSRAATSIQLGCADPDHPCKLPNAMAGDPPLDQVVTRTWEAGLRGGRRVLWTAGVFRASNDDDILFVTSGQTGFGFFRNFGQTRRQGVEVGANTRLGPVTMGAGYTYLGATYQSEETVDGGGNSTNDAALNGQPGVDGTIEIEPGDRIPLVPRHLLKTFVEFQVRPNIVIDADLNAASASYARGNENNAHQADGTFYLGPGVAAGYAVVNLGARYRLTSRIELSLEINNLFDRRYGTAAQLGPTAFTSTGAFIARPFPADDGQFPVRRSTFLAPGAPTRFLTGLRIRF